MNNPETFDCRQVCPECPLRSKLNVNEVEIVQDHSYYKPQSLYDGQSELGNFAANVDIAAKVDSCQGPTNGLIMRACGVGLAKELKFRASKDLSQEIVPNVTSPEQIYKLLRKVLNEQELEFAYTPNMFKQPVMMIPDWSGVPSYGSPSFYDGKVKSGLYYYSLLPIVGKQRPMPGAHDRKIRRKIVSVETLPAAISPDTYRIKFAYTGRSYTFRHKLKDDTRYGWLTPTQEKILISQGIFDYVNADEATLKAAVELDKFVDETTKQERNRRYGGVASGGDLIDDWVAFDDEKPKSKSKKTPLERFSDRLNGRTERDDDGWGGGDWDYVG